MYYYMKKIMKGISNFLKSSLPLLIMLAGLLLIILACVAIGSIIYYIIQLIHEGKGGSLPEATVNGLILSCVTISITLSVLVPWMISKTQIYSIAEETVKKYYDKDFSKAIGKTHNTLFQAFANDSRMIAYLLCRHNKPFWALGWVCKSSTTYDKVHDENQRKTYKTLSVSNIHVLIDCILQIYKQQVNGLSLDKILNNDNEEKKYEVAIRTTRDLVKFCSTIELRDKDYSAVFDDKSGKDIPETLNDTLIQFLRCLIKKLTVYCQETNQDLFDRLELENIDDENWEVHVSYYYKMEKWCNKHEAYKIESEFQKSAGKLYDMYSNYLQKLEN